METKEKTVIIVEAEIHSSIEKVWNYWTDPKHIVNWNNASPDWHTPHAENDPRTGGKFKSTMAARDGSMSFDFEGVYSNVQPQKLIEYGLADGRHVKVEFQSTSNGVKVIETFDPETENPIELQRSGWQAILDNFKKYVESL
jgi:uncharacterized protein YndB with AHSA1/START domain